jgi:hypothetical protein
VLVRFPTVQGDNLLRETVSLPGDLEGEFNLLLVAFQRWQQQLVDTWMPLARQLEAVHPEIHTYELPTIQRMNALRRTFINEGMRAGIPDPAARERTITLYLDKAAFREALELPHENTIYALLIDRHGEVLWRAEGAVTPEAGAALWAAVEAKAANGA